MSWHSKALWNLRKSDVRDDETALRLSKLLRDNRHSFMAILRQIEQADQRSFLLFLLNLDFADFDVSFEGLRVVDHVTHFSAMHRTPRTTKYAIEQKARRCRIAFDALRAYFKKKNRNEFVVSTPVSDAAVENAIHVLEAAPAELQKIDRQVARVLKKSGGSFDTGFRRLLRQVPPVWPQHLRMAKEIVGEAMADIARELSRRWEDERYVRAESASD